MYINYRPLSYPFSSLINLAYNPIKLYKAVKRFLYFLCGSSYKQGYGGIGQWKFIKSVLKLIELGVIRQKLYFSESKNQDIFKCVTWKCHGKQFLSLIVLSLYPCFTWNEKEASWNFLSRFIGLNYWTPSFSGGGGGGGSPILFTINPPFFLMS